jgi:hypothetical protein
MRAPAPTLLITAAVVLTASVAGGEAKVYGAPGAASRAPHAAAPAAQPIMPPESPQGLSGAGFDGLAARIAQATEEAAAAGATISVAVLDRASNQMLSNGNEQLVAIASVAKLFIADDLLSQESGGSADDHLLSTADHEALDSMLRSSDDDAAEAFWAERGGEAIIAGVASRYGLTSTAPPSDGRWWNTMSSTSDLSTTTTSCSTGPAACLASGRRSSSTISPGPPLPRPMATPSGSAFPTGSTPNLLPSSRGGCAVSVTAGCTCPPASSGPTGATSW